MTEGELKRGLGLGSAISIVLGYTIGISIFILIGPLAYKTGPALWLTYLMASVPALFVCFVYAQIGSALPVDGANYVLVSRTLGPFWGFMTVWAFMITTLIGIPMVAYGLAEYMLLFFPKLPLMGTAIAMTLLFGLINVLGVTLMGWIQNIMVIFFMLVLLVFGLGGLFNIDPNNIKPMMPNGFGPVFMAAIPAYFSFVGFNVLVELGEEIKNPARNIPRAILISFISVIIVYMIVTFTLTAVMPWQGLEKMQGAVAVAAGTFLPGWVVTLIKIGAIMAALTTLNAILATTPREVFALARDGIFPRWLAKVGTRFNAPYVSIILVTLMGVVGILIGAGIVEYAFVTVMGVMILSLLAAIGTIRLKKKMPDHYETAPYKHRGFQRIFWPAGVIVISLIYILLGLVEAPLSVGIFILALLAGILVYFHRVSRLKKRGITLEEIFAKKI